MESSSAPAAQQPGAEAPSAATNGAHGDPTGEQKAFAGTGDIAESVRGTSGVWSLMTGVAQAMGGQLDACQAGWQGLLSLGWVSDNREASGSK